jgi:L-ascorbate metabolism protein UlaG (beta-lactamase superfamily)
MSLQLQLIRSATVRIVIDGFVLLVDPYLAAMGEGRSYAGTRRSPLVPLPVPAEQLVREADAVFVSHLHSDHFDDAAHALLPPTKPLWCPAPVAEGLRAFGFTNVTGIEHTFEHARCSLQMAPGRHGPDAVLEAMGAVHGFVLRAPGHGPLYWVGDSIHCPEVARTIEAARPSTIVVHACGADWKGLAPLVMDGAMVEATLNDAPHAQVIATHLDAVDHATVSRADLRAWFAAKPALAARLRIPADGELIAL